MLIKNILITLFFILSLTSFSYAKNNTTQYHKDYLSILDKSEIYLEAKEHTIDEIIHKKFQRNKQQYINFGFTEDSIWIKFSLDNNQTYSMKKLLVINNPLLLFVDLYKLNDTKSVHIKHKRRTLNPSYPLTLPANSKQTYYLHIKSHTSLKFGLCLYPEELYYKKDTKTQLVDVFLIGIILTMMIYHLILFLFVRDKRYLYYSILLGFIIWLEMSFVGLTPLYLPEQFVKLDNYLIAEKINFIIIACLLYAVAFLQLKRNRECKSNCVNLKI